ncbi:exodeoxyribonuclease VII small subunit [Candidatus Uhrbacteria bacterium RIFCSPHIGHO2_12_FULL_54_23]|uniref:Exodeoxyribonuclease 7 small subunit n=3 Tax=Candidatus Uhriibacteriota TaxID=1752732 RepID=A0A1F7UI01_9BACT|nr:MAG: exodeoxyribonuclease VII small subunit [Candidatus Uhrbacteria bacterium RIFCSPHIGHO2_12_FULL_54_23]OGL85569.1 MAG: exodeoxyribonuclease VII small subunit [Candidatus Uhrbacteria bacterium RIFCSPLOWO2_01_FULL_55_36]OGL89628.1 MAG: exodeoxyribonuclease VII small subunit [Candidatus Uhrbacteria bacterium RIFCSPLOWO2_02_FULL_54_37]
MPKQKASFSKSFEELEGIVAKFEEGEIDLDEALVEFERGARIVGELKARLKDVENKVVVLKKKFAAADDIAALTADDAPRV